MDRSRDNGLERPILCIFKECRPHSIWSTQTKRAAIQSVVLSYNYTGWSPSRTSTDARASLYVPSDSYTFHQSLLLNLRASTTILQMNSPLIPLPPKTCPCIDWFGKVPRLLLYSVYFHHNNYGHTARGFKFVSANTGIHLYFAGSIPPLLYAIGRCTLRGI